MKVSKFNFRVSRTPQLSNPFSIGSSSSVFLNGRNHNSLFSYGYKRFSPTFSSVFSNPISSRNFSSDIFKKSQQPPQQPPSQRQQPKPGQQTPSFQTTRQAPPSSSHHTPQHTPHHTPQHTPQQPQQHAQQGGTPQQGQQQQQGGSPVVVQVNMANFVSAVIHCPIPVIVECYAEYFEEGKEMSQTLRTLAEEAGGALRLARVNVEQAPDLVEKMKLSNVPTVLGFFQGRLVNSFVGVQTPQELSTFVGELLKKGGTENVQTLLQEGDQLLKENRIEEAAQLFSSLLQQKNLKAEPQALAGLALTALAEKSLETAKQLMEHLKQSFPNDLNNAYVRKAKAAIDLAESTATNSNSSSGGNREALMKAVLDHPDHLQSRYDLALHYFQTGEHQQALDQAFEIVKRDRTWNEQAGRKLAIKIFEALGPQDPITKQGRKRLSNLLF